MPTTVATPGDITKVRAEIAQVAAVAATATADLAKVMSARLDGIERRLADVEMAWVKQVDVNFRQGETNSSVADRMDDLDKRLRLLEPVTTTLRPPVPTTPAPPPTTQAPVPTTTTTTTTRAPGADGPLLFQKRVIGGMKLTGEFARGEIAVDEANRMIYQTGHAQRREIYRYEMPDNFGNEDPDSWPILPIKEIIPAWSPPTEGYVNGLAMDEAGELWIAPRYFYDMAPPRETNLYARSGAVRNIPVPRQQYSGFLTSQSGKIEYLGGGGYESGQGSAFGPTVTRIADAKPIISFGFNSNWNDRCPREPNYFAHDGKDSWVCLMPRYNEQGILEGRWACDRIYGGGIELADGFYFFAWCAVGAVDYAVQSETFDVDGILSTYVYRFDKTGKLLEWTLMPVVGSQPVVGQDVGRSGRVYLNQRNVWKSGLYKVDSGVRIYE